ncbi:tyrosine-type recombinase/integrase [Microbacterium aerolatum]|uniref:tyrosine-type recombinase/integrase n=1 Tax=Microbacterium aerolatum TaxID=153731 RepID=UPI00384F9634
MPEPVAMNYRRAPMRGKGEGSVFKDSRGLWNGVIELPPLNGERRRKTIRRKSKKDLLEALAAAKSELQRLGDLPTSNQTVEQWFTYWLKQVAKEVRPNTLDGYQRTVRNHIIPAIGKVKLDKLNATHMRRVHESILAKGLSSTTALLAHRTMSVSFKIAMREGRIGRNPAELTAAPRRARPTLEALDLDEALHFLERAAHDPVRGARWATALLTGARRGEVLGLEVDRVTDVVDLSWQLIRLPLSGVDGKPVVPADYEYRHITGGLYLTRPKSSKSWRIIPLTGPLKAILDQYIPAMPPNEWGLLFTNDGKPISPDQASRDWRADMQKYGIEKNVRLHDARHSTVDLLLEAGIPEDLVMDIVGHSVRATTRAYKSPQNRKRLVAAMEQFALLFTPPETINQIEQNRKVT